MSQEVFTITTDRIAIYKHYLLLKKPFLERGLSYIHKKHISLNPKLIDVFAMLMYYNNKFKDLDIEIRGKALMSQPVKNDIINALDITQPQLNTYISMLRKYQMLRGNIINDKFAIYPNGGHEIVFKLNIKDNEE